MLKRSAFALVILFALSPAHAGFNLNSSGLLPEVRQVSLELPKTAPVPAPKPAVCKPFLMQISVGGVAETVTIERGCTSVNDQVWVIVVGLRGKPGIEVRVSSENYPLEKTLIDKRVKEILLNGATDQDADFIVGRTGPLLARAAAAPDFEKAPLLAQASEELKAYLARP